MDILSKRSRFAINVLHEEAEQASLLEKRGHTVIKLSQGDPPLFFPTPNYTINAFIKALRERKTGYSNYSGTPVLREAVAKRYRDFYKMDVDKDKIIVTNGVSEALHFLNSSLIDPGNRAIIFKPYYTVYMPYLKMSGGLPILERYDEANNWNVDVAHVENSLKKEKRGGKLKHVKYMLITNPNNPTGTVLKRSVLKEIIDIANDYSVFLVSDEIYDEIVYIDAKFTSVGELAKGIPHMILNGASKNFDATGFRIGFAVIPEEDQVSLQVRKSFNNFASVGISANTPAEYAIAESIRNMAQHKIEVRKMVKQIEKRVNFAVKLFNENKYLSTVRPNGAFYVFPKIDMHMLNIRNDKEFTSKLLKEEFVQVVRGSGFGAENHFRIIGLPKEDVLGTAIGRINNFCKKHAK
jgi:aspartate/methionine/tyrosine aminotransferase